MLGRAHVFCTSMKGREFLKCLHSLEKSTKKYAQK